MYCKYCGKVIDDDSTFCQHCGKPLGQETSAPEIHTPKAEPKTDVAYSTDNIVNDASVKPKSKAKAIILLIALILLIAALAVGIFFLLRPAYEPLQKPQIDQPSAPSNTDRKELSAAEIAKLSSSVLTVYAYNSSHELLGTGSGFVAFDSRTLVTNYHVIHQAHYIEAVSEGDITYNLSMVKYYDRQDDVAILSFDSETDLTALSVADSEQVNVGDPVYAIGSPLGLENTVSDGIISSLRSDGLLQITAPISHGSSGGALLNVYGEIIGITTGGYSDGQNLNVAVPSALFADAALTSAESLTLVADYNRPCGNIPENYRSRTELVEYGDTVYHCLNMEYRIFAVRDGISTDLGINGYNLNAYKGKLYYNVDKTVYTYDLSSGEIAEHPLTQTLAKSKYDEFTLAAKLIVSDYGITVVLNGHTILHTDFDGKVLFEAYAETGIVLLDEQNLGYQKTEQDFTVLNLPTLTERTAFYNTLFFNMSPSFYEASNGLFLCSDNIFSNKPYPAKESTATYYNAYTGEKKSFDINERLRSVLDIKDDLIYSYYFDSDSHTYFYCTVDLNGNINNLFTIVDNSKYDRDDLPSIYFTGDKLYYSIGSRLSNYPELLAYTTDLDGGNFTVIYDSKAK